MSTVRKQLVVGLFILFLSGTASAIPVYTVTNEITSIGTGSVGYHYFDINFPGFYKIETSTNNFDAVLHLFDASIGSEMSEYTHIGKNDDGGVYKNARLNIQLNPGTYVAAVSNWMFTIEEAISGHNNNLGFYGVYDLTITPVAHISATAPVPLPAAVWLMGSALLGLIGTKKYTDRKSR